MAAGKGTKSPDGKKKARKRGKAEKPLFEPTPRGRLKYEVAEELGLVDKVRREGWGGLTAAENGRIGGRMMQLVREGRNQPTERVEEGSRQPEDS